MPKVAILKSSGEYQELVPQLLELADAHGIIEDDEAVLIKPNLHAPQHYTTGGTVNPALVGALIDWARARGAGEILVADSPYHSHPRPEEVFTDTGMAEVVEARGAKWTVLTRHPYRTFHDASPDLPAELRISETVFSYDRIINVAVAKTHLDAMVTLGMKNLKGCVSSRDKRVLHHDFDISRAVLALSRLIHPDLTIVDGTLGMEGLGPASGTVAHLGAIFAGRDMRAVDAVAAQAMGFDIDDVLKLKLARVEGLLDVESIETVGEPLAVVTRRFERPYEAMARQLPDVELQIATACSACKLNLIRALCEEATAGAGLPDRCIAAGKGHVEDPDALLVGTCARDDSGRPYLPGCPPRIEGIKQFLSGYS